VEPTLPKTTVGERHGNLQCPELLGRIGMTCPLSELSTEEQMSATHRAVRRGIVPPERRELAGPVPRLLLEFPARRVPGGFVRFQSSAGKLEQRGVERRTVVLNENDLSVDGDGDYTRKGGRYQT